MKKILVTGGAGFVGSNLGLSFAKLYPGAEIIALDNLKRRGSELNLERFKRAGIKFLHGDVRNPSDLTEAGNADLIIDCAAEPSVLAGTNGSPRYVIETNLNGTVNVLEHARQTGAQIIFLSTSRVYPIDPINQISFEETETRFEWNIDGIAENFPMEGARSMYGASKLASEMLVEEYRASYGIKAIVNRCGVLTGPWQMGKTDQGVIVLWMAAHYFGSKLSYIGYGGSGKQVRDILHVDDLFDLLKIQLSDIDKYDGGVFNVGGGRKVSVSLKELTALCSEVSGKTIPVDSIKEDRPNDIRVYLSDCRKIEKLSGWKPKRSVKQILEEIHSWLKENEGSLKKVLIG
jgi:CDP-paratose 2-epimerase